MRLPAITRSRALTSWVSAGVTSSSSTSSILLATLFTFCPPGPDERTAVHDRSAVGITIPGATYKGSSMRSPLARAHLHAAVVAGELLHRVAPRRDHRAAARRDDHSVADTRTRLDDDCARAPVAR